MFSHNQKIRKIQNVRNLRDFVLFLRIFSYVSIISLIAVQLILYLLVLFKKESEMDSNFAKASYILNQIIFWATIVAGSTSCFYVMYQTKHAFIYDYIRNFKSLNKYTKRIELYKKEGCGKNWEFELNFDSIVFYTGFNYFFVIIILVLSKLTNNLLLMNLLYPRYTDVI